MHRPHDHRRNIRAESSRRRHRSPRNREACCRLWRSRPPARREPTSTSRARRAFDRRFAGVRRAYAGAEQRLVRVDVSYAGDDSIVHQHELDRSTASCASRATGRSASNAGSNGSGPSASSSGCPVGERRDPQHCAESPRVVIAQQRPVVERDVDVVVRARVAARAPHAECSRSCRGARAVHRCPHGTADTCCVARRGRSSRPRNRVSSSPGTGQRSRRSYTSTLATRRPMTCGAIPRRVVSTSGSSGIEWVSGTAPGR